MKRSIEVEDLMKLVESGLSSIEISKMYDIHQGTVSAILKRAGCEEHITLLKANAKSYSMVKLKDTIESLGIDFDRKAKDNVSLTTLAQEFNIAPQTLRKYLSHYRPELIEVFRDIGKNNKKHYKVTPEMIEEMKKLSYQGLGIDSIGKYLHIDGVTVRRHLIESLGEEEYQKLHPTTNFTENNGWNGKKILYKGKTYQSHGEVEVAKILNSMGLKFELHKRIMIKDKAYIPDFYIKSLDLYIEYAGILSQRFYRVKFMKKVNDYSLLGLNFIVVNEENIDQLKDFILERSSD